MSTTPLQERESRTPEPQAARSRFLWPFTRRSKKLGATLQASKGRFGSSVPKLQVPVHDIRLRILSLVVLAALAPALLVGTASYSTAKKILTEKLSGQLSNHVFLSEQEVHRFLSDRSSDTKVFASAYVVSQNLRLWAAAKMSQDLTAEATARDRLRLYLTQVQQRYPLYKALHIIDAEGRLVTTTRFGADLDLPEIDSEYLASRDIAPLALAGSEYLAYVHHPVVDQSYQPLGRLVTASDLEGLWRSLASEPQSHTGELIVVDRNGRLQFDSTPESTGSEAKMTSPGVDLALNGKAGVSEYINHDGVAVLGAYRYQPEYQLAYLVEVPRDQAFAASLWLRNFTLLVSFVAAGLVTAIAVFVILSLTRPIDALIAGAQTVASGDLSQQIPVSSKDQIGYLTQVFNRMTSRLLESREKLEKMTRTDELTGLPNRRDLDRMFKAELGRAERSENPLSVLMMDLDNFKQFNDQHGHLEGDSLLSEASHFLNLNLRPADIAARFGGEEFVVLLPDTTKRHAASLAERLRQEFAEACKGGDDSSPWVTISIGVATWPEDGKSKDDLIRAADTAMYAAKRAGRNRVRTAVFPAPLLEQTSVNPDQIA